MYSCKHNTAEQPPGRRNLVFYPENMVQLIWRYLGKPSVLIIGQSRLGVTVEISVFCINDDLASVLNDGRF